MTEPNTGPVSPRETASREWGVLTDEELAQRVATIITQAGPTEDAATQARDIIDLVRANTTCLGNMDRGCY